MAAVGVGNAVLGGISYQNQVGFSYHTMQWELLTWGMLSLDAHQEGVWLVGFSYHTMQLELLAWGTLSFEACQDRIR